DLKGPCALDVILLRLVGLKPVIVHGGGPQIGALMKRLGKEPRFVGGMRVTDAETVEIVEMVLVGKINKQIVGLINHHGGQAVGLSGKDASLLRARRRGHRLPSGEEVDIGLVGEVDGGMLRKVESSLRALEGGTSKAHILDGRVPHAILLELFTREGVGTEIVL